MYKTTEVKKWLTFLKAKRDNLKLQGVGFYDGMNSIIEELKRDFVMNASEDWYKDSEYKISAQYETKMLEAGHIIDEKTFSTVKFDAYCYEQFIEEIRAT